MGSAALLKRRGIMAAAAAAVAALAMTREGARVAEANDGDFLKVGNTTTSTNATVLLRNAGNPSASTLFVTNDSGSAVVGAASASATGVAGGAVNGSGVSGSSTSLYGVFGNSQQFAGVFGLSTPGPGVFGQSTNGTGVVGNTGGGVGVSGQSSSGQGVFGTSTSSSGVQGSSTNAAGVRGDSPNNNGVVGATPGVGSGVFGQSGSGFGVFGTSASGIGVFGQGPVAGRFDGAVEVTGDFTASGMKSAVVVASDGVTKKLYCLESPESWFEDYNQATLANGSAGVEIDAGFASVVDLDRPYHVFLTAVGDCNGLYVADQTPRGFLVKELRGGTSSGVRFSYRVIAYRRDVEAPRLQRVAPQRLHPTSVQDIGPAPTPPPLPASKPIPNIRLNP